MDMNLFVHLKESVSISRGMRALRDRLRPFKPEGEGNAPASPPKQRAPSGPPPDTEKPSTYVHKAI
jgi:hypothetical protein